MEKDKLIGRERECEELKWAVDSRRSELIVLYGRRRVGKTFLVRRFFNDTYCFHYVGAHKQSRNVQLQNFREVLMRYSGDRDIPVMENWHDAFLCLERYLESCQEERKIIFFDEKDYEQQLRYRKALFMEVTGNTRGPVHTFITPMGVAKGIHAAIVHSQLTAKDLFVDITSV